MYEHHLNKDLLPSYTQADYIYHEAVMAIRDAVGSSRDQDWWWDVWYNSTKVTGIRTLRFRILEADQATTDKFINAIIAFLKPLHPDSWQTFTYKSSVWEYKDGVTQEQFHQELAQAQSEINTKEPGLYRSAYGKTKRKLMYSVQKYGKHNVLMIYYRSNKRGEKIPWEQLHPRERATREGRYNKIAHAYRATFVPGKIVTIREDLARGWHDELPPQYYGKQGQIVSVDPKCMFTIRMLVNGQADNGISDGSPVGRTLKVYRYCVDGYKGEHLNQEYRDYLNGKTDEVPVFG